MKIIGIMGKGLDPDGKLTGTKYVGKDEICRIIKKEYGEKYHIHHLTLATPLKEILGDIFPDIPREHFHDPTLKEKELPNYQGWTARSFMEQFGTEFVRKSMYLKGIPFEYSGALWIRHLKTYIAYLGMPMSHKMVCGLYNIDPLDLIHAREYDIVKFNMTKKTLIDKIEQTIDELNFPEPNEDKQHLILISDVRFPNEYKALKEIGTTFVQVERTFTVYQMEKYKLKPVNDNEHESNTVHDSMEPDYVIQNNRNLRSLESLTKHKIGKILG